MFTCAAAAAGLSAARIGAGVSPVQTAMTLRGLLRVITCVQTCIYSAVHSHTAHSCEVAGRGPECGLFVCLLDRTLIIGAPLRPAVVAMQALLSLARELEFGSGSGAAAAIQFFYKVADTRA